MISLVNLPKFPTISLLKRCFSQSSDDVTQLIANAGYKSELHRVKTHDDYLLTLHRIPPEKPVDRRRCVLLMHGLFRNSADFLATGPQVALPYLLADHGYDVFLGNARGTKYSQEHLRHDCKAKDFWNFSWEEIGLQDLPAMIDFSLELSGADTLGYVGHSQGCTAALVLLAEKPEWNQRLSQLHLMAPAVFLHHATSPAYRLGCRVARVTKRLHKFDIGMVLRFANQMQKINRGDPEMMVELYRKVTCRIVGRNKGEVQLSVDAIKSFNHFMSPTVSANQLRHFLQAYESGKFRKFDCKDANIARYGCREPPEYDLKNVRVPTFLYHAEEDALVDRKSVDELAEKLGNVKGYRIVSDYNHLDVMLGRNSRSDLYRGILENLNFI